MAEESGQGARRLYLLCRRRFTGIIEAFPEFARQRLSYLYDARRIYRILPQPLRFHFWLNMFLLFLRALVTTASVFVMVLFIQSIASPQSLREGVIFRFITPLLPEYWIFRLKGDRTLITAMCMLVVAFIILKNVVIFVATVYNNIFTEQFGLHVSREAYARYFGKDYLWHLSAAGSKMIERIERRGQLTSMLTDILTVFGNVICAVILCLGLFIYRPAITALVFSVFTGVSLIVYTVLRSKIEVAGAENSRIAAKLSWAIRMTTRGIREVIIYRKQKVFLDSISETTREAIPFKTFLAVSRAIPGWFLEVAGFVIIFSVMVYLVDEGHPMPATIATMSMLLITAWRVLPLFNRSMGCAVHIRGIRTRALSCLELLESFTDPVIDQPESLIPNFHLNHSIELKNVVFRYPRNKKTTLNSLSLTIKKGECVALIGKSGAGKSTVGMVLAGLFEPLNGQMLVDGADLKSGILDSYRRLVGYVPQNPLLLPGSIANNIALSRWGEELEMERVAEVCGMAAMDFVQPGKKGLDFRIGDGGEGLSGGEAQRVAIARALFTNPEIIIFDEATSSLDRAAELAIGKTLESLRGMVTTVIIAHRLTTIEHCDRVIWLENGKVKEIGRPSDILSKYSSGG